MNNNDNKWLLDNCYLGDWVKSTLACIQMEAKYSRLKDDIWNLGGWALLPTPGRVCEPGLLLSWGSYANEASEPNMYTPPPDE